MGRAMEDMRRVAATALTALALTAAPAALAQSAGEPMMLPEPTAPPAAATPPEGLPADSYVAEVIDSTFFVGPAEFFALDLPTRGDGIQATHLTGTATATGKKGDIIVRLFSGVEYDRWLKKRGGPVAKPFWISPKSRTVNLDQPLPAGQPVVMLLDNGYSLRTPKRVHCQLQIQYQRTDGKPVARAGGVKDNVGGAPPADDLVTPRSNDDEETAPPPPPPPDEGK